MDLEEARLLGGELVLRWKAPNEMTKVVMSAQQFHELLNDLDSMISTVEQDHPTEDDRYKLATAIRMRWLP